MKDSGLYPASFNIGVDKMERITDPNPIDKVSFEFRDNVDAIQREWAVEVEVYFDGEDEPPVIFTEEEVSSFSLLEEIAAPGHDPLGVVSSNEFNLRLSNDDRKLTPTNVDGEYYGKLTPNILVIPYIGIKNQFGVAEGVALGKFWTRDWRAESQSMEVEVPCYDLMYKYGQLYVPSMRAIENTTIADLFSLVLESVGLGSNDYEIDEALDVPVRIGWLPEGKLKNVLQTLSQGLAFVDVTRDSKIRVRSLHILQDTEYIAELDDTNQIITASIPAMYQDVYTRVKIKRYVPTLKLTSEILRANIEVPAEDSTEFEQSGFTEAPAAVVERVGIHGADGEVTAEQIRTSALNMSLKLNNASEEPHTVDLIIYGRTVEGAHTWKIGINEELEEIIDKKELKVDNVLIQDQQHAEELLPILMGIVSDPYHRIITDVKGNPALVPGNVVKVSNPSDKVADEIGVLVRRDLRYEGGLEEKYELFKSVGE